MTDDPNQIAEHLIGRHGVDGALMAVREEIERTQGNGDNYSLSVWREVRQVLQTRIEAAGGQDTPTDVPV